MSEGRLRLNAGVVEPYCGICEARVVGDHLGRKGMVRPTYDEVARMPGPALPARLV